MIFTQMEYWYQRAVFLLLKQIVTLLRWITLPVVHRQIGRFLYKTDKTSLSKTSVMLSITGVTAIVSTGLLCFFFCTALLFCTAASLFALSANGPDSFLLTSFLNFYFLIALPFFLFSMFFMFMGVLFVFYFNGYNVFQCLYVLSF